MIYFLLCLLNLFICISLTLFWKGNMITTCVGPINLAERWQTKALTLPTCNICCFFDREFSLPKYLQKVAIYLASLLLFTFFQKLRVWKMRAICFALIFISVLAHDHDSKKRFLIKTKKGKIYLVEKGKHSHNHEADSGSDYEMGWVLKRKY